MPTSPPRACIEPGCAAYALAGKARCHVHQARRAVRASRHERGYGAGWERLRAAFLGDHPWCSCGERATDVDHITPKRRGGDDEPENLQALCHPCHSRKTGRGD